MAPATTLTITELGDRLGGWDMRLELAGAGAATVTIVDPAGPREEEHLRRYLEEHLAVTIADPGSARRAAAAIAHYGTALHAQLFSTPETGRIHDQWSSLPDDGRAVEVRGSGSSQRLHWELMCAPGEDLPVAVRFPMTRTGTAPPSPDVAAGPLRVLLVTARGGVHDHGARVIRRPLQRSLGAHVPIEVLRPGTLAALEYALDAHPYGHYPVVHLDMHGRMTEHGGILSFEEPGVSGLADVDAATVATLLGRRGVALVVLNACQSSMPIGDEASIAAMLVAAGVRAAVGMRYSITVDGAVRFSSAFYQALAAGAEVAAATRDARAAMYAQRVRHTSLGIAAEFDDWLLPVCHRAGPVRFRRMPDPGPGTVPPVELPGRDADIQNIERRVTGDPAALVVHGPIGCGKSALLWQLAAEWTSTDFTSACPVVDFEEPGWDVATLRRRLPTSGRWALMIDHPHRAGPADRAALRTLLADLTQGGAPPAAILVADRHPGGWVAEALSADAYPLGGVDDQAVYALARVELGDIRHHELVVLSAYQRCLRVLGGNPGALKTVWPLLAEHDPRRLLAVLQGGELAGPDATLRRLRESLAGLAPSEREPVEQLSPYTGLIAAGRLPAEDLLHGLGPAHRAGLLTAGHDGVVPHPLLGPVLRHGLSAQPDLLAARRAAFLRSYLAAAAHVAAALDRGDPGPAVVTAAAEQENLQTALALALVDNAPEVDLVRALDAAFVREHRLDDRVALYDALLTWIGRHDPDAQRRRLIYQQQHVYALGAAGRLDAAGQAYHRLLDHLDDLARTEPDAAAAARPAILHGAAVLARRRGDRGAARDAFREALNQIGVDGPHGVTATRYELGRLALEEGQLGEARQELEAALPGMRQPPRRHAAALLALARAERADGEPRLAASHLEEAHLGLTPSGYARISRADYPTLRDVLLEIGSLAVEAGRLDGADVVLTKAAELVQTAGNASGLARVWLETAKLKIARQDNETAIALFEQAATRAEQTRDQHTAIDAYRGLADLVVSFDPVRAELLRRRADVLAADERQS